MTTLQPFGENKIRHMSPLETEQLQCQIWMLMEKQVRRYTMGESSSVPEEIARKLLKSIYFTLRAGAGEVPAEQWIRYLQSRPVEALFQLGQKKIYQRLLLSKTLFMQVKGTCPAVQNIAYRDTVNALEDFFTQYDFRSMAYEIPCMIDYQLCVSVSENLSGVFFIQTYLERLFAENKFLKCFSKDKIILLLHAYCIDYQEQLVNLAEPVLVNAIGLMLLNQDIFRLEISFGERRELFLLFQQWSRQEAEENIAGAIQKICGQLRIHSPKMQKYFLLMSMELAHRIWQLDSQYGFQGVFLSFKAQQDSNIFE